MAIKSYFFNAVESGGVYDRVYNAEDFTSFLGSLISNGVKAQPSYSLQVYADSGLTLQVAPGECWIKGHKMTVDAAYSITLDAADSSLPRRDTIVARLDMTNRTMVLDVLKGIASSTAPVRVPTVNELALADIYVRPNATTITQADITDTRGMSKCPWVAGIITQLDTSTLMIQYNAAFQSLLNQMNAYTSDAESTMTAWMALMQSQFDAWFETLTQQLVISTYVQKFEKTEVAAWGSEDPHEITLDMTGYSYDSSDIIFVYVNGLKAIQGIDYSLFISSQVKVQLNSAGSTSGEDQTVNIVVLKSKVGFNTLIDAADNEIVDADNDNLEV